MTDVTARFVPFVDSDTSSGAEYQHWEEALHCHGCGNRLGGSGFIAIREANPDPAHVPDEWLACGQECARKIAADNDLRLVT
jgi:hypothetical protein